MSATESTYVVNQSGLMRCCLASLDLEMERRLAVKEPLTVEGQIVHCRYCSSSQMICRDGCWEWDKEAAL